ncbi:M15 family metallopeptidase [Bacillus kexueae]|uniref:M15 family metallopeptidase n=1 Tax=Aeribacillus kexueae TaxID=2078952 RepID=UPI001FAE9E7F|nr:M15 family metallopeptidase [Bacillus kexueae]
MKKIAVGGAVLLLLTGCSISKEEQPQQSEAVNEEPIQQQEEEPVNPDFLLESVYFNEVKEVDGKVTIQNPDNILVLVNKDFYLPSDYIPSDLVRPNIPFSFGDLDIPKSYMRAEAAKAVEQLFEAANKDGIQLFGVSAYRPFEYQLGLFNMEVQDKGEEVAAQAVAQPGQSEHQTGLTIDVTSASVQYAITQQFGETKEGKWLAEHAHEFGFIIRYPSGKEEITKYQYEPWHIRYVGIEVASILYKYEITLEEYFHQVKEI